MMVTRLAWMAHKLVSSNKPTKYASDASWSAKTAEDWNRKSVLKSCAISRTKALERELADQEFGGLLVLADFPERDGTRAVPVRLLDAAGRRGGLARRLGGELLTRGLATGGLTGSLLRTGHCYCEIREEL